MADVTYEDAEKLRKRLGVNKLVFCRYLRVSRTQYYRSKSAGVAGPVQQVLRLIERDPWRVIEVLSKHAD